MPIKPENKVKYPPPHIWKAIRAAILERAHNCCEMCGVENYAIHPVTGGRQTLTITHYPDPDPANCEPGNLLALCNACHNRLDAPMRAQHSAETRRVKKHRGQLSLFGEQDASDERAGGAG